MSRYLQCDAGAALPLSPTRLHGAVFYSPSRDVCAQVLNARFLECKTSLLAAQENFLLSPAFFLILLRLLFLPLWAGIDLRSGTKGCECVTKQANCSLHAPLACRHNPYDWHLTVVYSGSLIAQKIVTLQSWTRFPSELCSVLFFPPLSCVSLSTHTHR